MRQKTSAFQSSSRNLIGGAVSPAVTMSESERFLRAAEQAFNAEDSQRLAARQALDRLISSDDE